MGAVLTDAPLLTVGHGTADRDRLGALLRSADVRALVDIRTVPGSRRNPDVSRAELARWVPEAGVLYRWEPRLGGFRRPPADSPDRALRNESFRGYAWWMRDPAFLVAVDELLADVAVQRTAVMCSESVWWRCHRRMLADFVTLVRGLPVLHLMPDGRLVEHHSDPAARKTSHGLLVYDGGLSPLSGHPGPSADAPAGPG